MLQGRLKALKKRCETSGRDDTSPCPHQLDRLSHDQSRHKQSTVRACCITSRFAGSHSPTTQHTMPCDVLQMDQCATDAPHCVAFGSCAPHCMAFDSCARCGQQCTQRCTSSSKLPVERAAWAASSADAAAWWRAQSRTACVQLRRYLYGITAYCNRSSIFLVRTLPVPVAQF